MVRFVRRLQHFLLFMIATIAFSLAQKETRLLQYNLEDNNYYVPLEMGFFDTTGHFRINKTVSVPMMIGAMQSILCEMNQDLMLVDDQYAFQCCCKGVDSSNIPLSSYVLLETPSFWDMSGHLQSGKFYWSSWTFYYRVLHIGDDFMFPDDATVTTTDDAVELLRSNWQSVLDTRCTDGTFDPLLPNYAVEESTYRIYCSPVDDQDFLLKKWSAIVNREQGNVRKNILCSALMTTIHQFLGLGLPQLVVC